MTIYVPTSHTSRLMVPPHPQDSAFHETQHGRQSGWPSRRRASICGNRHSCLQNKSGIELAFGSTVGINFFGLKLFDFLKTS